MALPPQHQRLPDDILREVFSRTSLETLGRIRLLGKEWNQMTYDPTFKQQFPERTKTISGFFIQKIRVWDHRLRYVSLDNDDDDETKKVSLSFLPSSGFWSFPVASTPQGILLCQKRTAIPNVPRYYVCKPTTKQWHAIPNPKTRCSTKGIGMMVLRSNPLRYKIVRFSRWDKNKPNRCQYEVFDSETWAWKQFKGDISFPHDLYFSGTTAVVSACGKIHWLQPDNHIFAFDLNTESWEIFALPQEDPMEIVRYEGRLGMVCLGDSEDCMRLWVMEDYGHKKVWRKRKEVNIEELKRSEWRPFSVLAFTNTDVVLMTNYHKHKLKTYHCKLLFYKFENYCSTTCSKVVTWEECMVDSQVFPLESDFEPVYLGPKLPPPHLKPALNTNICPRVLRLLGSFIFFILCILVSFFCLDFVD